ncbi:hypothetical protein B296_00041696 [Ensete ventricosum]|uniref:Uncharacterized protein n=1 Tax=Ensete ventricosum TaxID=4639 RepID=A0A426ZKZ2_ENSVE|nr:hypothetical protein B296_00041696 [Ensete ventricosum]
MVVAAVEATVAYLVVLFWTILYRVGSSEELFLPDLKKDLGLGELRGIDNGLEIADSGLSILYLEGPGGGPRDDLVRGPFWSSCFSATNASMVTY